MRCWLLSFFITVLPGLSEAGNLVFSLEKRTHYSDFSAHSTFTFMDDGSYSFDTSTGGFRLCSGLPAGKFSGQLDRAQTETLLSSFKEMGAACKALDDCETSADRWGGHYEYSVVGWAVYSKQTYFIQGGSSLPNLFQRLFELERTLHESPDRALYLEITEDTPDQIHLQARYIGEDPYPLAAGPWAFLRVRVGSQRLGSGVNTDEVEVLQSGQCEMLALDKRQHSLKEGDYIVYAPARDIHPCVVIGESKLVQKN